MMVVISGSKYISFLCRTVSAVLRTLLLSQFRASALILTEKHNLHTTLQHKDMRVLVEGCSFHFCGGTDVSALFRQGKEGSMFYNFIILYFPLRITVQFGLSHSSASSLPFYFPYLRTFSPFFNSFGSSAF